MPQHNGIGFFVQPLTIHVRQGWGNCVVEVCPGATFGDVRDTLEQNHMCPNAYGWVFSCGKEIIPLHTRIEDVHAREVVFQPLIHMVCTEM